MIDVRRASALLSSIAVLATLAGAPVRRAEAGNTFTNIKRRSHRQFAGGVHPNVIGPGYALKPIATGTDPLENPPGSSRSFGFLSTGTRTEPDENTYLVLNQNPGGPTPGYDYGEHFLFQGHENGGGLAYVTRINLDVADPAHRITLLTPVGPDGKTGFSSIDALDVEPAHADAAVHPGSGQQRRRHRDHADVAAGGAGHSTVCSGVPATRASTPTTG